MALPIIPSLSQINPSVLTSTPLRFILILSFHLCLGLPRGLFLVGLPVKIFITLLPSFILATCPVCLNLLDLITLTILGGRYKVKKTKVFVLNIYLYDISLQLKLIFTLY